MVDLPKTIEIDGKQVGYLSPSQVNLLLTCPRKWKYRYLDKLPDPMGIDALFGRIVHSTLEFACNEVINNNRVPDMEEIEAAARFLFNAALNDPQEMGNLRNDPFDKNSMSDEIAVASRATWGSFLEKRFHPIRAEQKVIQQIDDWAVYGLLDLLYKNPKQKLCVIDWKTTKRAKQSPQRQHFYQVITYANALRQAGIEIEEGWLAYIVRERNPYVQWQKVVVSESSRKWAESLTLYARQIVKNEMFMPNPIGAGYLCSPVYCAFWDRCEGAPKHEHLSQEVTFSSKRQQ